MSAVAWLFVTLVLLARYANVSLAQTESDLADTVIFQEQQVQVRKTIQNGQVG